MFSDNSFKFQEKKLTFCSDNGILRGNVMFKSKFKSVEKELIFLLDEKNIALKPLDDLDCMSTKDKSIIEAYYDEDLLSDPFESSISIN